MHDSSSWGLVNRKFDGVLVWRWWSYSSVETKDYRAPVCEGEGLGNGGLLGEG